MSRLCTHFRPSRFNFECVRNAYLASPRPNRAKIFWYSYLGLGVPTILLMILGAAIGGAVPSVPGWAAGYEQNLVGGVLAAMLEPAGGFGKFLVVILSFTLLGNMAATCYSVTLNFQTLAPIFFKVPRYVFSIVITAILIPVSIRVAVDLFLSLENFVALISYWSSAFLAVVLVEHLWFRRGDCANYDPDAWDTASMLPSGAAAMAASVLSFGLIVPCIDQAWFVGPIAKTTGDIGFEVALSLTALLYLPLRHLERKRLGR